MLLWSIVPPPHPFAQAPACPVATNTRRNRHFLQHQLFRCQMVLHFVLCEGFSLILKFCRKNFEKSSCCRLLLSRGGGWG